MLAADCRDLAVVPPSEECLLWLLKPGQFQMKFHGCYGVLGDEALRQFIRGLMRHEVRVQPCYGRLHLCATGIKNEIEVLRYKQRLAISLHCGHECSER